MKSVLSTALRSTALLGTALVALCAASACGDGGNDLAVPAECNPLGGPSCLMPWPSSAYLTDDHSTVTGFRVELPIEAMPRNLDDKFIDPTTFNTYDGFSTSGPILAAWDTGVSADDLPPHSDIARSLDPDASVAVVNMETGERVPLFAEVDMNAKVPEERALIIHPLVRMDSATRYAVGIRNTVKAADGSDLPISPQFAALVDGKTLPGERGKKVSARYDDIFAALEDTGMPREDLVLAWDFVTASDELMLQDLLSMRSQALDVIGDDAADLTFDAEEIANDAPDQLLRKITGTFDVPMFLDDGEEDLSVLVRDDAGLPAQNGIARANYAALIPKCVETAPLPVPVVVFGHGIFGNAADALDADFLFDVAQDNCMVLIGTDWIGLTNRQLAALAFTMNDLNRGLGITEKLAQALINFIALQRLARFQLGTDPEFQVSGTPIIDPDRVYFYGASLGGIEGTVFMALDPDIELGALGVTGGPYSLLFERTTVWPALKVTMKGAYDLSPWDYQMNIAFLGLMFDKVDPMTVASRVLDNPLPDTPPKQLLLYMGIGDALVTNLGSEMLARTLDIPVTAPSVRVAYGLSESPDPEPSAMTVVDEVVDEVPPDTNDIQDFEYNDTHVDTNKRPAIQREVFDFFKTGVITNPCRVDAMPAPCSCPTGACD